MNQTQDTIMAMEVVFKATMELYEGYFKALEAAINATPDSDMDRILELRDLAEEAEQALESDMALFEKAANMDEEALQNMDEELKIQAIHNKLKQ